MMKASRVIPSSGWGLGGWRNWVLSTLHHSTHWNGGWRRHLALGSLSGLLLVLASVAWLLVQKPAEGQVPVTLADLVQSDRAALRHVELSSKAASPPIIGDEAVRRNAAAAFSPLGPAAEPFRFAGDQGDGVRARACLAAAMLYEAGDDGVGQLAVGQVVLNRVRHPAFPKTVCGVVTQGSMRTTGCQFTFTCDGALARTLSEAAKTRALVHAELMLNGLVFAGVGLATHYHTNGIYPWWSSKLEKVARVGAHLFFRWPGRLGATAASGAQRAIPEPSAALFLTFIGRDAAAATGQAEYGTWVDAVVPGIQTTAAVGPGRNEGVGGAALPASNPAILPSSRRLIAVAANHGDDLVVGATSLEGNTLVRMFAQDGIFYLHLTGARSGSSRRRSAEALCGGRDTCRVYGWNQAADAPPGPDLDLNARQSIAFAYVRQTATGLRPPRTRDAL